MVFFIITFKSKYSIKYCRIGIVFVKEEKEICKKYYQFERIYMDNEELKAFFKGPEAPCK